MEWKMVQKKKEQLQQLAPAFTEDSSTRKNSLDFRKYTQQIWLAGLGAFARAEEEGGKLFEALVKVGEELEAKRVGLADQTVGRVSGKARESVESVIDTKEKMERLLDQGMNQSLHKMGLATVKDVQHLESLIIQLHDKVDQLTQQNRSLRQQIDQK